MTIRAYIRRRFILAYGLALVGFALTVGLAILFERETRDSPLFFIAIIPFLAAVVFINFGIRCPRCEGNVSMTPAAYPTFSKKHRFNFCPYCGVSVDENV